MMDNVEYVIQAVRSKQPLQKITESVSWDGLSLKERNDLLEKAVLLWKDEPGTVYVLLQALFAITKDDWYRLKLLNYILQHADCVGEAREKTLPTMRYMLNRLGSKDNLQNPIYKRSQAVYAYYSGKISEDAGDLGAAVENWRTAQTLYRELSSQTHVDYIQKEIERLQKKIQESPPSIKSQSMDAQQLQRLQLEIANAKIQLEDYNIQCSKLKTELAGLDNQIKQRTVERMSIQKNITDLNAQLTAVRINIKDADAVLARTKAETEEENLKLKQIRATYDTIKLEKDALDQERKQAKNSLTQIKNEIQKQKSELLNPPPTPIFPNSSELQAQLNKAQQKITELEAKLAVVAPGINLPSFVK